MEERIYNPLKVGVEELRNKSGVYQIRNLINGHLYIGSAKNLCTRFRSHFARLRRNNHVNKHLQAAYNKYGADNFIFEVIEYCPEEVRFNIEQYWIDKYFDKKTCYNGLSKAIVNKPPKRKSRKRGPHTKESLEKISKFRTGINLGKDHPNSKAVVCLETKKAYESINLAYKATKIPSQTINRCCKLKSHTAGGFHWRYKKDYDKLSPNEIQDIIDEVFYKHGNYKQIICLETRKIYPSASKAEKDSNCVTSLITDCCNNKFVETNGFHWMYYEDYKNLTEKEIQDKLSKHNRKYYNYKCIETGKIYRTVREASLDLNVTPRQITASCRGEKAYTHGYHFEFII